LRLGYKNPGSMIFGLATLAGAAFVAVVATVPGSAGSSAPLLGFFPRNLELADASLVADKDRLSAPIGGRTLNLRGRDLRFAKLDRADLRQVDLTGAQLDGASLIGADLRGARLGCADGAALQQADGRAKAGCTSAKGADFGNAQLNDAGLAGADLTGAHFDEAVLDRADLSRALLSGATFERAKLQRASLASANLRAASLAQASLHGATLTGARLEMADLSGAGLQGARLVSAHLSAALLRAADLEGAELQRAKLYGADLRGAKLKAADLAGASVWHAIAPGGDAVVLADIANVVLRAPAAADLEALKAALASEESQQARAERTAGLKGLIAALADGGWESSADGQAWAALLRASEAAMAEGFKTRLSEHLGRLACRTRLAETIATAIVTRAVSPGFKGDVSVLHDRLKATDCAAVHTVPRATLIDLAVAAEAAKVTAGTQPGGNGGVQGQ
jgi:uncharacterized protein YjbI with pentapeptide repeats